MSDLVLFLPLLPTFGTVKRRLFQSQPFVAFGIHSRLPTSTLSDETTKQPNSGPLLGALWNLKSV